MLTKDTGLLGETGGCCELEQTLKRFWEKESDRVVCTEEERSALEAMISSVHYNDRRYNVAILWKERRPCLLNNRQVAESRPHSTERNLKKKRFIEEYHKVIDTCEKGVTSRSS